MSEDSGIPEPQRYSGDGTQECETPEYACQVVQMIMNQPSLIEGMCKAIIDEKKKGTYDGAYKAVKIAAGIKEEI